MPELLLGPAVLTLTLVEINLTRKRNSAVKNSRERYTLSTWRKITGSALLFVSVLGVAFYLSSEHSFVAIVYGINAILAVFNEYKENKKDEDDWFNGRGKKIWDKLKSFASPRQTVPAFNT